MGQLCHACTYWFLFPLVLSLLLPLTDGAQVFPTLYTISCDHDCGVFSEPSDTCTRNGTQTTCYYSSPTTPKLVDCDPETEYLMTTGLFTLTFRFEQQVSLVNFTLHYSCIIESEERRNGGYSYRGHYGQLPCSSVGQFQETFDVNMLATDIRVELTIQLAGVFSLSEVKFFDHTPTGIAQLPSSNITTIQSQSLQLFCATNECGTFVWEWYHNGTIMNGSEWVIEEHSGTRNSSLTVYDVDYNDAGNYTCSVSRQGGGQWSHAYTVEVVSGTVTTLNEQTYLQQHRTISSPLPKSSATPTMTTTTITLSSLPPTLSQPPTQTPASLLSPLPTPSSEIAALPSPPPPIPSHTASKQTVRISGQSSPSTETDKFFQSILTLPIIAGAVVGTATMVLLAMLAVLGLLCRRHNQKRHLLSASENNPQLSVYAVVNKDTPPEIPLQNLDAEGLKSPSIDMHLLSPPKEQCDNPLYSTARSPKSTIPARDDINPAYSTVCDDVRTQTTRSCPHPNQMSALQNIPDIADTFDPTYSAVSEPKTPAVSATEPGGGKATQRYAAVANSGAGSYDPLLSTTSEKADEVLNELYAAVHKDIPPPLPAHYSETDPHQDQ